VDPKSKRFVALKCAGLTVSLAIANNHINYYLNEVYISVVVQ